jgi:hypothetical protein
MHVRLLALRPRPPRRVMLEVEPGTVLVQRADRIGGTRRCVERGRGAAVVGTNLKDRTVEKRVEYNM